MLFSEFANDLSNLEQEPSRLKMMCQIENIFKKTDSNEIDTIIYLLLGQFGAKYKSLDLGIAEKTILVALSKSTGKEKEQVEDEYKKLGDLGLTAEKVMGSKYQRNLFSKKKDLFEVYNLFEKMAVAEGKGAIDEKMNYLINLINNSSPIEAKYIVRIAEKNMRIGLSNSTIIDALSLYFLEAYKTGNKREYHVFVDKYGAEADRYFRYDIKTRIESKYNIYPDLGSIAKKLFINGVKGLDEIDVTPFVPVLPALAERLPTIEKIVEKLGKCVVEPKYDGFRLQCHYDGENVKLFTRNLEDMSDIFPDVVKTIKENVKKYPIIFECEAIGYNKKEKKYYPFQVTIKRKRKYDISEVSKEIPLRMIVFDIMYLKKSLIDLSFVDRRKILKETMVENENLAFPKFIFSDDPKEIRAYFDLVTADGNEGIMLKDPAANYTAGARKFAWVKYKKSYNSKTIDSLDLVILGYFLGKGQRSKFGIGALLVGCYNDDEEKYQTIAKVGSGLTDAGLEEFKDVLEKISKKTKPMDYDSELEPDFWVSPKYVVEVLYDEITKSPIHTCAKREIGGLALRFPRLIKFRPDKNPERADKANDVKNLFTLGKY